MITGRVLHVVPRGDLVEHETATEEPSCVCGPRVEHCTYDAAPDGWRVVHNSLDRREDHEEKQ